MQCSLGIHLYSVPYFLPCSGPQTLTPELKVGERAGEGWRGRGALWGRSRRVEWWEVKTGPREGGQGLWRRKWGNANQMLAQGTVRKNRLSQEPGAGLPLGRAGRAGTDVWRKERRKKKRSRKKIGMKSTAWRQGHSPTVSGLVFLVLRPVAECVQINVCSQGRRACICTQEMGRGRGSPGYRDCVCLFISGLGAGRGVCSEDGRLSGPAASDQKAGGASVAHRARMSGGGGGGAGWTVMAWAGGCLQ